MLKVKKEFIGKVLKKGGISILLDENSKQASLKFVVSRFGDQYTEPLEIEEKEEVVEENVESDGHDNYFEYEEYTLKELREVFPSIKSVSKKDFIEQIYDNNK